MKLSRVDRIQRTFDVATLFPQLAAGSVTAVQFALLPPRSESPVTGTVWSSPISVVSGSVTVLLAGPEADATGALVVPATADLWAMATNAPETEAVKIPDRITVAGSSALTALPSPPVLSVVGATGVVTGTQIAADPALHAAYVPKWKPSTAYTAGEPVLNPSGQTVTANTTFTSGATYNAANWTIVSGGATGALLAANNLSDVASAATARTNLGLGTAATQPTSAFDAAGAASAAQAAAVQRANHTGTQSADTLTDGTTNKAFLATERTKLAGIATGATAVTVAAAGTAGAALSATDATTTNSRTPTAHAATHATGGSDPITSASIGGAPILTPTATKTAAYTAVVGDLAMMNVAGGATVLTLPTAPADKAQVGYRAIGATPSVPLTVNRGGSTDTIGTAAATSAIIPLADEVTVLQYDAANTRWLAVSNVKTLGSTQGRAVPGRRIAALGDSITAGIIGASTPNANNVLQGSYLMYGCMASLGRLEFAGIFGVPGDTTAMILARVGQVIAAAPDACIVLGGTNDGAMGTLKVNLPKIVQALAAAGIEPIMATLPPSSSTNAMNTGPHNFIRNANAWIVKYATLNGLRYIDFFGALVDPAIGRYLVGYNSDITHPNQKGYRLMGTAVANALSTQVKAGTSWLTQDVAEYTVFAGGDGGLFTTGTTLPAGAWTQSAGAAGAFVTDSFFSGRAYQIARASTDATSRVISNFINAQAGTTFVVGDLVSLSCKVKTTGFEASGGTATISVSATGSTGATNIVSWQIGADFASGAYIYYEYVVPTGTTQLVAQIRVDGGSGSGDTLTVGQFGLRNLTRASWP